MCFIICCDDNEISTCIISSSYPANGNLWFIAFSPNVNEKPQTWNLILWLNLRNPNFGSQCIFETLVFDVQSVNLKGSEEDCEEINFSVVFGRGAILQLPEGWNILFSVRSLKISFGEYFTGTASSCLWPTQSIIMVSYTTLVDEGRQLPSLSGTYFPSNPSSKTHSSIALNENVSKKRDGEMIGR